MSFGAFAEVRNVPSVLRTINAPSPVELSHTISLPSKIVVIYGGRVKPNST